MTGDYTLYRRVLVCPSIADMTAPSLVELLAGTDITDALTPDGLALPVTIETVDDTLWASPAKQQRSVRYGWSGAALTAERTPGQALWDLAASPDEMFLVVLVGRFLDASWRDATEAEVYRFTFGFRNVNSRTAETPLTFTAPLDIAEYEYAVLPQPLSTDVLLQEDGQPVLQEDGGLIETGP